METVAKQNKGKHKYSKDALKELKKAMEQIQMIYGSCIQAISGDVNMDIKERLKLIPYESAVGLIMTIVSTLIFGVFKF